MKSKFIPSKDLKIFIISDKQYLKDAIKKIESNHLGFVLTCDEKNSINGFITDGDVRRALIKNPSLDQDVSGFSNKEFIFAYKDSSRENILKQLDSTIKAIPILDDNNQLIEIVTKNSIPLIGESEVYANSRSPVRVSFGGGGSDLTHFFNEYGGAVINITISLYSHAFLRKRNDKNIYIKSADLKSEIIANDLEDLFSKESEFGLIISVIKCIEPDFGFDLYLNSDYPISSGLGGSAVISSAVIGCFNQFRTDKWDDHEIAELAYEAERILFNIAGGWQDQYATVFGGFNFMEFRKEQNIVHPLRLNKNVINELQECLVLCDTNSMHDSGAIHEDQKESSKSKDIKDIISQNVDLTYEIRNALLKGNLQTFGENLHKAWNLKRKISSKISNSYLDDIYNGAISNGAVGGKLLGAGGGGFFIFYVDPSKKFELIEYLHTQKLKVTNFNFDFDGLQSWSVRRKD
jgi:D-glycero-alpha-D-manno-heptose-7-phosphate kinase